MFIQIKDHIYFIRRYNNNIVNSYWWLLNSFSLEPLGQFQRNLAQCILEFREFKWPFYFKRYIMFFISKPICWYNKSLKLIYCRKLWWHISAITCQIFIMSSSQIFLLTCQIFMLSLIHLLEKKSLKTCSQYRYQQNYLRCRHSIWDVDIISDMST